MTITILLGLISLISLSANIFLWIKYSRQSDFIKNNFEAYILAHKEISNRVDTLAKVLVQYELVLKILEQKKAAQQAVKPR